MDERRTAMRVQMHLPAQCRGECGVCEGTIEDISADGCFVITSCHAEKGELISIEIGLPQDERLGLWCTVVRKAPDLGLGLRFTNMGEKERAMLTRLAGSTGS